MGNVRPATAFTAAQGLLRYLHIIIQGNYYEWKCGTVEMVPLLASLRLFVPLQR